MHTERPHGPRWPTPDQIALGEAIARGMVYRHPKGVVLYRSHAEADADMRKLVAAGMAEVARRRGWFAVGWFRRAVRWLWLALG